MCKVINEISEPILNELIHPLSYWLKSIAKTFEGHNEIFFDLIGRILILESKKDIKKATDLVSMAINQPIGHITNAVLIWYFRQTRSDGQILQDEVKSFFTKICNINIASFRYGRLLLATNVIALFRIDPVWTKTYLLPFFEWERSHEEAEAAWKGFLWAPHLYAPFLNEIKKSFLNTSKNYEKLDEYGRQYATLLTYIALESDNTFTQKELAEATKNLPNDGLESVIHTLTISLEGAGDKKSEYWKNRILPYIKTIWPKSRNICTNLLKEKFALLCIAAKESFPEAMRELGLWLGPTQSYYVIFQLRNTEICQNYPKEALNFLDIIIRDSDFSNGLNDCLEKILGSEPTLSSDSRFIRLKAFIQLHEG